MTDYNYQLYSSRNFGPLGETLKMLAAYGYKGVEGYGGLYADKDKTDELMRLLGDTGLSMPTGHFGFTQVRDDSGRVLDIVKQTGMEAVVVPAIPADERVKDAAGWAAFGRELAEAGKPYWDAGLTFGWHNHAFEFADIEGAEKPLDLILAADDRLALEMDVAWVAVSGEDPETWIAKYGDRIVAAHVKDIAPPGSAPDEDGWADVGHGTLNWPSLMQALKTRTNARWFVMEHDNPADDDRFARLSIEAGKSL
ncbi:sugar phosphate isomerase/epimerase family protein [Pseudoroseicyclus tamaricis]|uniref:Sugar phosphate isomerase/epimerase n=1 Tax=Pseudoroseicyclus tamaricis TaxID=2705421 RepID=A0A6B2JV53_9RHOB|nr:sugar phosphate isomerase/epimerase [Pseudoroseicyclus tamaricis]NDV02387.1 sugar phosphate isomerase/epimerase [Pseudoroseicyclus tamaricis]